LQQLLADEEKKVKRTQEDLTRQILMTKMKYDMKITELESKIAKGIE
jgi:hypothetical protein